MIFRMIFGLLMTFSSISFGEASKKEIKFSIEEIKVGDVWLKVEVADTEEKTQRGLMYRKSLDAEKGMLFVFENEEPRSFWMKNTFIGLDIGYFNENSKLIDIQQMEPVKSEMEIPKVYPSLGPAMYALEVNVGWFKKHKIKLGDKLIRKTNKKSGKIKK